MNASLVKLILTVLITGVNSILSETSDNNIPKNYIATKQKENVDSGIQLEGKGIFQTRLSGPANTFENNTSETTSVEETSKSVGVTEGKTSTWVPGIMNSFENATYWAETEEAIVSLATKRQRTLKEEIKRLKEAKINLLQYRHQLQTNKWLWNFFEYIGIGNELHDFLWEKTPQNSNKDDAEYAYWNDGFILPNWPNQNDLEFAMHSLTQIQEVYNFDYNKLPIALSPDTKKPVQLNGFHCAEIGMHALYREHYAVAIEWIEHAVEKVTNSQDYSIPLLTLETNLELAIEMHNEAHEAEETLKSYINNNLFVNLVENSKLPTHKRQKKSATLLKSDGESKHSYADAQFRFNGICSGKDFRTTKELSGLICWYDTSSSPDRAIMPYKKELLSFEPEVVQVYDFMGDKLITSLLNNKTNCSWIAQVTGAEKPSFFQTMRIRTASNCWPEIPKLKDLWRKISSATMTDLRNDGSHSPFQTLNYLFGRFHGVHIDALQSLPKNNEKTQSKVSQNGDRIISIIFYMNDVGAGGSTAFPSAGTAALPVKGSIVFWKNLYRNGSARIDTWHGGCPVLYGHKQSGTVHLYVNSQFRAYPCTLDGNE